MSSPSDQSSSSSPSDREYRYTPPTGRAAFLVLPLWVGLQTAIHPHFWYFVALLIVPLFGIATERYAWFTVSSEGVRRGPFVRLLRQPVFVPWSRIVEARFSRSSNWMGVPSLDMRDDEGRRHHLAFHIPGPKPLTDALRELLPAEHPVALELARSPAPRPRPWILTGFLSVVLIGPVVPRLVQLLPLWGLYLTADLPQPPSLPPQLTAAVWAAQGGTGEPRMVRADWREPLRMKFEFVEGDHPENRLPILAALSAREQGTSLETMILAARISRTWSAEAALAAAERKFLCTGSDIFYRRPADELNAGEAACLAFLNERLRDVFEARDRELADRGRDEVLARMEANGFPVGDGPWGPCPPEEVRRKHTPDADRD